MTVLDALLLAEVGPVGRAVGQRPGLVDALEHADETLQPALFEQLRGDRDRAARRAPVLQVEPVTEPAVESAPEEPELPRSTFGERLRRAFRA